MLFCVLTDIIAFKWFLLDPSANRGYKTKEKNWFNDTLGKSGHNKWYVQVGSDWLIPLDLIVVKYSRLNFLLGLGWPV